MEAADEDLWRAQRAGGPATPMAFLSIYHLLSPLPPLTHHPIPILVPILPGLALDVTISVMFQGI